MSILSGLRSRAQDYREPDSIGPVLAEAVAEIERLRDQNESLRSQLAALRDEMEPGGHVSEHHLREAGIRR